MTTLKPHLLRADTIDLQSHEHPSAKDHSQQPMHASQYGYSHAGPHHAQALRHANEDAYHERRQSPHLSEFDHRQMNAQHQTHMYDDTEDEEDEHMHDGPNGHGHHDGESEDGDGNDSQDEDLDDDMIDKISSSPSIEDGKHFPTAGEDDFGFGASQASCPTPTRGICFTRLPTLSEDFPALFTSLLDTTPVSGLGSAKVKCLEHAPDAVALNLGLIPHLAISNALLRGFASEWNNTPVSPSLDNISCHLLPEHDPCLESDSVQQIGKAEYAGEDDWEDANDLAFQLDLSSEDDQDDLPLSTDSRFLDSGWGGECLRELEDIDFEFVYALHTFVATVEGQANATKGDTMVLLDDSNSYWWLVRVVKDGSIGYLPAEHIETPTERLARLNKHRNIDFAASMLGDNPEKSKNPLKKAMRRRAAKTVNFAPPIYYEPVERDWSDEEEHDEDEDGSALDVAENGAHEDEQQQHAAEAQQRQTASTDATNAQSSIDTTGAVRRVASDDQMMEPEPLSPIKVDSVAPLQLQAQDGLRRSRQGVVRNTDSFFKDDTAETKKISLTPRLLRGDSDANGQVEQEQRSRPSLDTFDRMALEEKPKDSSKKKEKKGMLSGLFKRKERNTKNVRSDDEFERASEDSGRSPQSKDSMDSLSRSDSGADRKPSKLQKPQPGVGSPKPSPTEFSAPQHDQITAPSQPRSFGQPAQGQAPPPPTGPAPAPPDSANGQPSEESTPTGGITAGDQSDPAGSHDKRSVFAPIADALRSKSSNQDVQESAVKPVYSKRAKERFAIDDSGSEDDSTPKAQSVSGMRDMSPTHGGQAGQNRPDSAMGVNSGAIGTETSTVQFGPRSSSKQSQDANIVTPVDTDGTAPSDHTASTSKPSPSFATHTPSTSRSTPTWSDASLRSYMDSDQDIRDLLIIVHDKSNITPVEHNHPLMTGLFSNERNKLAEMSTQLDSMLSRWMSKKKTSSTTPKAA